MSSAVTTLYVFLMTLDRCSSFTSPAPSAVPETMRSPIVMLPASVALTANILPSTASAFSVNAIELSTAGYDRNPPNLPSSGIVWPTRSTT